MSTIKYKSCPWCGSAPISKAEPLLGYTGNYIYYIQCSECGAVAPRGKLTDIYMSEEKARELATKRWNHRADDPEL